jgi:sulfur-carrier protein
MARVTLAPILLRLFPDAERRCEIETSSIAGLMEALEARWPGMRARICDERPAIRRHMTVFVDGRRAAYGDRLAADAEVFILTAISGG